MPRLTRANTNFLVSQLYMYGICFVVKSSTLNTIVYSELRKNDPGTRYARLTRANRRVIDLTVIRV